jgi:flagellar basal-body rod modification protein FlgD
MSDTTVAATATLPTASDPAYAALLKTMPGFTKPVKKSLDQQDFLKLLSTQLANQDPLAPSNDLNSISQMASFSSAESMGDMVTSLKAFIVSQDFASAQAMLGKYVTVKTGTDASTGAIQSLSGTVSNVGYDENGVSIITVGDKTFSPADVIGIQLTAPPPTTTAPTTGG